MNTPKKLTDLKFMDNVLHLKQGELVQTEANRYFHEVFETNTDPKVNKLFEEDGKRVFEAYTDSGSDDYLYLVK